MEKKQTAVQWLYDRLKLSLPEEMQVLRGLAVVALEMEKEQIMMAVKDSWYMAKGSNFQDPQEEQYYKETYKSE